MKATAVESVHMAPRGAVALVGGSACFQFGAALAVPAFAALGPLATSAWRFLIAAALMLAVTRPRLRGRSGRYWARTLALGIAISLMTHASYITLSLIPQGAATTLEFLGPLTVGIVASRQPRHLGAALLALLGVVLIGGASTEVSVLGLLSGLATATAFATYVVLQAKVGTPDLDQLALAFAVAAGCSLPLAIPTVPALGAEVVLRLIGSAVVGVVTAYSLDAYAIHRLGARVAGVMLSLDPALGTLAGFLVLGQILTMPTLLGMVMVVVAGVLAAAGVTPQAKADDRAVGAG